jgi:hypothetical protein
VEAVRNYLKKKNAKLEYLNQMAVCTLDCIRSIGAWLDENINEKGGGDHIGMHSDVVWEDTGIHPSIGLHYKIVSRYPGDKYEEWIAKITHPRPVKSEEDEIEMQMDIEDETGWITLNALYNLARPPKPPENHKSIPKEAKRFYMAMRLFRKAIIKVKDDFDKDLLGRGACEYLLGPIGFVIKDLKELYNLLEKRVRQ